MDKPEIRHHLAGGGCRLHLLPCVLMLSLLGLATSYGSKTYQAPTDFIKAQFGGKPPAAKVQTLTSTIQSRLSKMNGRRYGSSRVRYWRKGSKTVYILDDIGKTRPITIGYVIESGKVSSTKVLVYRESHGSEVSRSYFTKQLTGISLRSTGRLSKKPRNISGATLSVRTMSRMARMSLYLSSLLK